MSRTLTDTYLQTRLREVIDSQGNTQIIHPETVAGNVLVPTSTANVFDTLDEVLASMKTSIAGKANASDIKDSTITLKINGANKDSFTLNQASGKTIDLGTYLTQHQDITGKEDKSNKKTTIDSTTGASDTYYPSTKAVKTYVDNSISALPTPMQFKGSLGTGGTITSLPTASSANTGHTYKVITAGTYATKSAKVGDVFISNGSSWELIPSGDEPSGTVTSVGMTVPTGLSVSGSPITSSGTLAVTFASGYSIPTTAKQTAWDGKQDALASQTAYSAKGSATKVPQITTNALGQVTNITEVTITDNDTGATSIETTGSGNAVTSASYSATNRKITLTKGTTFLTQHQDISGKADKANMTAGTYSAVTVNNQGIVTAGGQFIEFGSSTPSASLVTGGLLVEILSD